MTVLLISHSHWVKERIFLDICLMESILGGLIYILDDSFSWWLNVLVWLLCLVIHPFTSYIPMLIELFGRLLLYIKLFC